MALDDEQRRSWADDGFVLLPGFVDRDEIARINALVDELWTSRAADRHGHVVDVFVGHERASRLHLCDAPAEARDHPYKLNDLFLCHDEIRNVAVGDALAPVLAELLGGTPMICNSLNFEHGSQQPYHFDTFFMPSPTPNKMVASWIALEATTPDNGPLTYYPGSHHIDPYLFSNGSTAIVPDELPDFDRYIEAKLAERGLEPVDFHAEQGDVFIWHSQLFHGGRPINDARSTRRSLVTHYFTTEDFPEVTPGRVSSNGWYLPRSPQPIGDPDVIPVREEAEPAADAGPLRAAVRAIVPTQVREWTARRRATFRARPQA